MDKTIKVIDLLKEASEGNNITFRDGGGTYKDSLWTFINMYTDKRLSFDEIKELLNSEVVIIEEQQDIDYWEEIANTFRKYGETLAEKFAKIGRQIDKNIKDKE